MDAKQGIPLDTIKETLRYFLEDLTSAKQKNLIYQSGFLLNEVILSGNTMRIKYDESNPKFISTYVENLRQSSSELYSKPVTKIIGYREGKYIDAKEAEELLYSGKNFGVSTNLFVLACLLVTLKDDALFEIALEDVTYESTNVLNIFSYGDLTVDEEESVEMKVISDLVDTKFINTYTVKEGSNILFDGEVLAKGIISGHNISKNEYDLTDIENIVQMNRALIKSGNFIGITFLGNI